MTIIRRTEVPYLNEDIVEKYNNVIIISAEGLMMKMNALMLCAMSHSLKMALLECDDFHSDHTITTEFSLEELKQVKDYCTKGSSNVMSESIMNSFGLLTPLAVENKINFMSEPNPVITSFTTEIPMKHEIVEIKVEPLENIDFDYTLDYAGDNSFHQPAIKEKTVRKIKQKRKKPIKEEDWEPKKLSGNKVKPKVKTMIKPSKAEEIPRLHNIQWSDKDLELFKKFELPKPLQEYISKQKQIDTRQIKERMNDEKKPFQCSQCQMKFANEWNLNTHVIKYHNQHLSCSFCSSAYFVDDIEDFKKHIFIHLNLSTNSGKFKSCIHCGKTYNRTNHFKLHLKQRGPLHNDICSQCPKKLLSFKEYQDHVNDQHYGIWKFKCGFENCGEMFDNDKQCIMHSRDTHRQNELKPKKEKTKTVKPKPSNEFVGVCEQCGHHYKSKAKYDYHMYTHHNNKYLNKPCPHCNKIVLKLKVHIKTVHLETQCPQCGKMVTGTKKLASHIKSVHTSMKDRPHGCETCGKRFFEKHSLEEHYNVHTGAKPFKCKYCPSAFASKGTHAMHQKGHLGIKRKPKQ